MNDPIFREVAEKYIVWLKANRTEQYWKRQERILRNDVLPIIGELSCTEILSNAPAGILSLSPEQQKRGLAAHNAAQNVIGWRLKTIR